MDPKHVSRYIRPEDVALLDESILQPILTRVGKEMAGTYDDASLDGWIQLLHKALLRGDLAIVIDDTNKRLGIVRTDKPPYASLLLDSTKAAQHTSNHDDPLGIRHFNKDNEFNV